MPIHKPSTALLRLRSDNDPGQASPLDTQRIDAGSGDPLLQPEQPGHGSGVEREIPLQIRDKLLHLVLVAERSSPDHRLLDQEHGARLRSLHIHPPPVVRTWVPARPNYFQSFLLFS